MITWKTVFPKTRFSFKNHYIYIQTIWVDEVSSRAVQYVFVCCVVPCHTFHDVHMIWKIAFAWILWEIYRKMFNKSISFLMHFCVIACHVVSYHVFFFSSSTYEHIWSLCSIACTQNRYNGIEQRCCNKLMSMAVVWGNDCRTF